MTYYKPCRNCAIDQNTCPNRQELKDAISGLYVTSLNFNCRDRRAMFEAGDRVSFPWTYWEESDYGESSANKLVFTGTVVCEKGNRFIVRVDGGEGKPADYDSEAMDAEKVFRNDRLVIKVKPLDLSPLPQEVRRDICQACTAFRNEPSRCYGYGEENHWDSYWSSECINAPETSQ